MRYSRRFKLQFGSAATNRLQEIGAPPPKTYVERRQSSFRTTAWRPPGGGKDRIYAAVCLPEGYFALPTQRRAQGLAESSGRVNERWPGRHLFV